MSTYTVIEKQNSASQRDGITIQAKNLTQAKRKATKTQSFQDTFLELLDSEGNTVAVKEKAVTGSTKATLHKQPTADAGN